MKIPRQEYTAEFKELAVKRVKEGLTPGAVAKELGLIEQTLRNWVKAAATERVKNFETPGSNSLVSKSVLPPVPPTGVSAS